MSKKIDEMVNRFLGWKLPTDFAPDGGIKFTPSEHPDFWPIGTHLFTASQAKAMFEYCLAEKPTSRQSLPNDGNPEPVSILLAALKKAKWMLERDFIDPQKMEVIEQCDEAIEKVTGVEQ